VATGLTGSGLEHLHAVAEAQVGDSLVPGLVALVARGEQVHVETLGTLAVGAHRHAAASGQVRAVSSRAHPSQKAHGGLGPDVFMGKSWGFGQSVLDSGAYGWGGGLGTSWLVDPTCDLVVTVLTQRMSDTAEAPQVHRDIETAAYAALG